MINLLLHGHTGKLGKKILNNLDKNLNINYLGFSNWGGDGYSTGYIDDFRYYSRVLSTLELTQLYNLR
jgi:hypothetical protein